MQNKWPWLYAKTKTGAIKVWRIEVDDNLIMTRYGIHGGIIKQSTKTIQKGKNIGKINETTPSQQAYKEALAKHHYQQAHKNYYPSIHEATTTTVVSPMLADRYVPGKTKLKEWYLAQPKLNGVRCIAHNDKGTVKLFTKTGTNITNIHKDLASDLEKILPEDWYYDGELFVKGWSFEKIVSAVKKDSDDTIRRKIRGKEREEQLIDWVEQKWNEIVNTVSPVNTRRKRFEDE